MKSVNFLPSSKNCFNQFCNLYLYLYRFYPNELLRSFITSNTRRFKLTLFCPNNLLVFVYTNPLPPCYVLNLFFFFFFDSFNGHFKDDMAWLLLVPFITTGCLLLILHGWTQVNADVLPTIMTGKKR